MQTAIGDPTTDEHVKAKLDASIRANYQSLAPASLAFAHITISAAVLVFLRHVDGLQIIIWSLTQSVVLLAGGFFTRRATPRRFLQTAFVAEAAGAASWAMFPLFALATSPDWQALQGLLLIAVMMSTLGNTTASRGLHLAGTVPIAILSAAIFTVRGEGAAQWIGAGFAIALPFTVASGAVLRQVQSDLFESSLRNENFAASLRTEGDRLKIANDQLETANSHLDKQSRRDELTGLYNRAGFLQLLNKAVSTSPGQIAVCYLDLDGFKRVNDAFGHRFGDLVLCATSRRIDRVLLPTEILARQGGDELTLFAHIDHLDGVTELGERILSVFEDPFLIEGRQIEIGVSAGLVWLPEPTTSDDLMRFADTALYKAKEQGRGQFAIFNQEMRSELDSRTQLQTDLGAAFARSEITPYLQPIVDVNTGRIATAEALARWEHSSGVRTATDFIDTARDLGMLDRINDIVVQKVFEFQGQTRAAQIRSCPITVNVSPIHLEAMLNRVLVEPLIDPIVIEITEDGIFSDLDRARKLLDRARAAGIQVLLDDFGVGFSSLSIATELPIDGFKIDRGFVASLGGNPSAVAAVQAIVQLAQRMDLHVVAEGVETLEHLRLLRELGVGFAQGFLFSPAVPVATFAGWLETNHHFDVGLVTTPSSIDTCHVQSVPSRAERGAISGAS